MSLVSLRAKIKEKLDAYTGTGQPLAVVYAGHEATLDGYPAVTFDVSQSDENFFSTSQNEDVITYDIFIHVPIVQDLSLNRTDAAGKLDVLMDTIIAGFREDYNLGGEVAYCKPISTSRGEYQEAAGLVAYAKLVLECHIII